MPDIFLSFRYAMLSFQLMRLKSVVTIIDVIGNI